MSDTSSQSSATMDSIDYGEDKLDSLKTLAAEIASARREEQVTMLKTFLVTLWNNQMDAENANVVAQVAGNFFAHSNELLEPYVPEYERMHKTVSKQTECGTTLILISTTHAFGANPEFVRDGMHGGRFEDI